MESGILTSGAKLQDDFVVSLKPGSMKLLRQRATEVAEEFGINHSCILGFLGEGMRE